MENLSKAKAVYLRKFLKKSIRHQFGKFLIEGEVMIREALDNGFKIETLVYGMGRGKDIQDIIRHKSVTESFKGNDHVIKSLSEVSTPQGLVALVDQPETVTSKFGKGKFYAALDSISDPGNMGTIIRSASWFGLNGIICGENCVEVFNGKVIRSSMGSVFQIPIMQAQNLSNTISEMKKKNYNVYGTSPNGGGMSNITADKVVVVIGNEAKGMSNEIQELCTGLLTIPGTGKAESLNAGVSAGIVFYEFSKIF